MPSKRKVWSLDFVNSSRKKSKMMVDQDRGGRMGYSRRSYGGSKRRYSPYSALKTGVIHTECVLTCNTSANPGTFKHLVSEFDPTKGGFVSITKKSGPSGGLNQAESAGSWRQLPMHCYDLNFYPGMVNDNTGIFPKVSTTQNDNINSRMWVLGMDSDGISATRNLKWRVGHDPDTGDCTGVRYVINNPVTSIQDTNMNPYMYRKNIKLDFILYGCSKIETKYDIRVVRFLDEKMCPDYSLSLTDTQNMPHLQDWRQNMQNMITPFVVNPLLKNEPGPRPVKKWFTTVAKKIVTVGEQTTSTDTIPCVRTSLTVFLNKAYNYAWNNNTFNLQNDQNAYDGALTNDTNDVKENNPFCYKPPYKQRYYLLIRALCPLDTTVGVSNEDDNANDPNEQQDLRLFDDRGHKYSALSYIPTYDLMVRTSWALVRGAQGT